MSIIDPTDGPQVDNQGRIIQKEEPKSKEAPAVPDKLQGKSMEEVYDMYLNAEKDRSRIANELGEQRKLTDRFLKLEEDRQQQSQPAESFELDATDLLADPVNTLDKYFERKEAAIKQQYEDRIRALEGNMGQQALVAKHPDATQITNDPKFLGWVQENSYRARIAAEAVQKQDLDALDYLLTEYKHDAGASAPAPAKEPVREERHAAARAASMEKPSSGDAGSGGEIYSRNALIRMKLEDPESYADPAFQAEIIKAYAEGRVR